MKKRSAQINIKFYANTVANGMSGKKLIAQPLVRCSPFAKEKKTHPEGVQIQKKC